MFCCQKCTVKCSQKIPVAPCKRHVCRTGWKATSDSLVNSPDGIIHQVVWSPMKYFTDK